MKTLLTTAVLLSVLVVVNGAQGKEPVIHVQADQALHPVSRLLTGACIEDANHQIYGGLYSQMVFGESFQEPVKAPGLSGMWRGLNRGDAKGRFAIVADNPFVGSQSQQVTFESGSGQWGVENQGLNRWGMNFVAGRTYEGCVWARADKPIRLFAALESRDGSRIYAETDLSVTSNDWQRLAFTLTPDAAGTAGRLALKLKQPGAVVLGYAFLQPGEWGRFKGLPVRRDVAEGLIDQGITVLRYGGSMVNNAGYRWKKMIGPRDRRPPYAGHWYPHSSNGWGIPDFMSFCEAAGFEYIPALNIDETPQDIADFVEYAKGPADSEWGRRRAADGRPLPYNLKYIQLGNEERVDDKYAGKFEALATAIWAKDKDVVLVVADWIYGVQIRNPFKFRDTAGGITTLAAHQKILRLAKQHDREVWFDVHVGTDGPRPDSTFDGMFSCINALERLAEGARFKVAVLEFNSGNHAQKRALANALAINAIERDGRIPIAVSATSLQPDGQNDNGWDQGLLFLNPSQVWLQPPGYVTQMIARNYQPKLVKCEVAAREGVLDANAKGYYSMRTVEFKGERLAFACGDKLSLAVKLVPREGGGLQDVWWPANERLFGEKRRLALRGAPGQPTIEAPPRDDDSFMTLADIDLGTASAAGITFRRADGGRPHTLFLDSTKGCFEWVDGEVPGRGRIAARTWPIKPGGKHTIRVINIEQHVVVYLDDRYVMNGRGQKLQTGGLALSSVSGKARLRDIQYWGPNSGMPNLLPVNVGAAPKPAVFNTAAVAAFADPAAKTFSVTDFGAKPNDGEDDAAAIRAAVAAAAGQPGSTLLFPRGQYDIRDAAGVAAWKRMITAAIPGKESWRGNAPQGLEGSPQEKNTVFRLNGCRRLTIDGQGSTLMIHGLNQTLLFEDCRDILVRNLKIDHEPPTAMTGKVLAVAGRRIDVEILDARPVGGEPFIALQAYDPVTRLPTGQETFAGVQSTELLREGVLRLNMTRDERGNFRPPVGHLLAMRHVLCGYEPIEVKHSSGVLLEGLDIHAGAGMGIVGVGTENLTLSRVRVLPRTGTSRLVSTTADATHFVNCSGTVTLEGCHFEGMGDDHLNVHGQYEFVHRRLDARTIEARIGTLAGFGRWSDCWVWGWAAAPKTGDPLGFFRLPSLDVTAKARVESIRYDGKTGRSRITFADPLPDAVKEGDQFQDERQIPALRVRNCFFGPNRARGTLITTRDAVVEGCTFDRTGGSPVCIWCEVGWLEAPAPANVVIRNNRFLGCGYAVANEGAAITAVFNQGGAVGGWMRDLTIEGNLIKGYPGAGVLAAQVDGLVFRNNRFEATRPAMALRGCRNVHSEGNRQDGGKPEIQADSRCEASTLDLPDAR